MSLSFIAVMLLIPLVVLGIVALCAWLQITRVVIAEEGDEDDGDGEGTPLISPGLKQILWRGQQRSWVHTGRS